jgi:predicted DsbA family dithiol-disulfide isomerase
MAQAAGIPMIRTSIIPNSRPSLEAAEFVRETAPEAFDRFHKALFRAYFEQDRNIGDIDTLMDIARAEGIDADALREALTERRYAEAVDERIQWAASRGLTSTPFFIFVADKLYGVPGAQEYEVFQSVMERLGVPPRAQFGNGDAPPPDTSPRS